MYPLRISLVLVALAVVRVVAQPSGTTAAPPPIVGTPPDSVLFSTDAPSSGFWRESWLIPGSDGGNPQTIGPRVRVNDPFVAFQAAYKDRRELRHNGMVQIRLDDDVTTIRAAELYLEVWGGHPGTIGKRVTLNGRTTYDLPENGTADRECTHLYPSLPLRITDLLRGYNVLQFACDRGQTFWGHFLVDQACLRYELPVGHAALAKADRTGFGARVQAQAVGETIALTLVADGPGVADIAAVEFYGFYEGYDENGSGGGRQWHGFTRAREPVGHLGTVKTPPFSLDWDVSMLPAQAGVGVRALVRFKSSPDLVYRTPVRESLEIATRPTVDVAVLALKELPRPFWSRANRLKSAAIVLPMEPSRVERAELHVGTWTGGPGEVKDYFKFNGRHFPAADSSDHRSYYHVFPIDRGLLRAGENTVEVLSDTEHHGIELLTPGPALIVRYRK